MGTKLATNGNHCLLLTGFLTNSILKRLDLARRKRKSRNAKAEYGNMQGKTLKTGVKRFTDIGLEQFHVPAEKWIDSRVEIPLF
ncbi:MAG: hypothetical protein CSA81_11595 [Acidobacteria bacterium]|nr:MAG: hypothetical protein CSA81_11595 [Acidobacteriota bacterium]PIE91109.1 MAG: hypothetical protein CR997_03025 [Acidobacteriota bacterium]